MFLMFMAGSLAFGVGLFVMTAKCGLDRVFKSKIALGPVKLPALLDFAVTFGASGFLIYSGTMTGAFAGFLGGLVYSLLMWIAQIRWKRRKKRAKCNRKR